MVAYGGGRAGHFGNNSITSDEVKPLFTDSNYNVLAATVHAEWPPLTDYSCVVDMYTAHILSIDNQSLGCIMSQNELMNWWIILNHIKKQNT